VAVRAEGEMPPEQAGKVEAVQEESDQGSGADFEGLQAEASGQGGRRRGDLATGDETHARGDREAKPRSQGEKILAGLALFARQPGQDCLGAKVGIDEGSGKR
jgi:hypothetical protein